MKTHVTIRFLGGLRSIAGTEKMKIELTEVTPLKNVIKTIVQEIPQLEGALIDCDLEDPRINNLILVNDKEISVLNGLETKLKDQDEVVFIPVLHTG